MGSSTHVFKDLVQWQSFIKDIVCFILMNISMIKITHKFIVT
jgi:hypothetical protein